jgi:hypothetical protein
VGDLGEGRTDETRGECERADAEQGTS